MALQFVYQLCCLSIIHLRVARYRGYNHQLFFRTENDLRHLLVVPVLLPYLFAAEPVPQNGYFVSAAGQHILGAITHGNGVNMAFMARGKYPLAVSFVGLGE